MSSVAKRGRPRKRRLSDIHSTPPKPNESADETSSKPYESGDDHSDHGNRSIPRDKHADDKDTTAEKEETAAEVADDNSEADESGKEEQTSVTTEHVTPQADKVIETECNTAQYEETIAQPQKKAVQSEQTTTEAKSSKCQLDSASESEDPSGFRCIDVNLLATFISKFPCPNCLDPCLGYSDSRLLSVREKKTGLASVLEFTCGSCGTSQSMTTSARAGPSYEVNSRFNATMFTIKSDFNKAKRFCSSMKMPEPLPFRSWMNKTA